MTGFRVFEVFDKNDKKIIYKFWSKLMSLPALNCFVSCFKSFKKNSLLLPLKISCYENALTVNHKTDKKLMWLSQLKNAVFSVERENAKKPPKM